MSYEVKQGNIFGRIGSGIGKGLAEQVPKEIERGRLASGLRNLSQKKGLDPFEQLAEFYAIPGVADKPQLIQSGTQFLRQRMKGNALANQGPKPSPFQPRAEATRNNAPNSSIPSLTEAEAFEKSQQGYIPPTQEEIYDYAGQQYDQNPALFDNDPQKAIEFAQNKAIQDEKINQAYQSKHQNLTKIQDNVVKRLKDQSERLGVEIPSNIYSRIEDKAIQATKPKNLGGRGLTEQQAMKEYGEDLDQISRDYKAIDTLGNWGIVARPAKETLTNIKSLQQKFEKNNDLENFADSLIAKNKLSPKVAYALAYPVSHYPEINRELNTLPAIKSNLEKATGITSKKQKDISQKTLDVSEKLVPLLKKSGASPLAIAYELEKRGYDPNIWLNYVIDHRDDLNLLKNQDRQLDKPNSISGTMNDWWLSSFSGIEGNK